MTVKIVSGRWSGSANLLSEATPVQLSQEELAFLHFYNEVRGTIQWLLTKDAPRFYSSGREEAKGHLVTWYQAQPLEVHEALQSLYAIVQEPDLDRWPLREVARMILAYGYVPLPPAPDQVVEEHVERDL